MDKLQRKSTELRLYCDLLVQQVTSIQNAANGEDEEGRSLGENSQMVTATCKTFLKTLKEAMNLFEERVKDENSVPGLFSPTMSPNRSRSGSSNGSKLKRTPSTTSLPIGLCAPDSPTVSRVKGHNRQASTGSLEFSERNHVTYPDSRSLHSFHGAINESDAEPNSSHNSSKGQDPNHDDGILVVRSDPIDPDFSEPRQNSSADENFDQPSEVLPKSLEKTPEESQKTETSENLESLSESKSPMFFSQLEHSFVGVKFQTVEGQLEIPTESFLLASGDFLPILDKLGSKAFSPVKMDINGNITKIRLKFETNKEEFTTLQSIIRYEQKTHTTNVSNSATDAIMWLKRGLSFVAQFLQNVGDGENDLTQALQEAYTATLSKHHGWVVRGVFALAVKAAPYYDDFIKALAPEGQNIADEKFQRDLRVSLAEYTRALRTLLQNLDSFYTAQNLESNKLV